MNINFNSQNNCSCNISLSFRNYKNNKNYRNSNYSIVKLYKSGTSTPIYTSVPLQTDGTLVKLINNLNIDCASSIPLTPTVTPTPTTTPTKSVTPTVTPTITYTPTKTATPTKTVTPTKSVTPTVTPTITYTPTKTATPTNMITPTVTPTNSLPASPPGPPCVIGQNCPDPNTDPCNSCACVRHIILVCADNSGSCECTITGDYWGTCYDCNAPNFESCEGTYTYCAGASRPCCGGTCPATEPNDEGCPQGEVCCSDGTPQGIMCMPPLPPEAPYSVPCGSGCVASPNGITYYCAACPPGYGSTFSTAPNGCVCLKTCS